MKVKFEEEDIKEALELLMRGTGLRIFNDSFVAVLDDDGDFSHFEAELDTTK